MRKILLTLALFLGLAQPVLAQEVIARSFVYNWDADSTTATYCTTSEEIPGDKLIKTSGSSTTVVENTASDSPFTLLGTGDVITVIIAGTATNVVITAKASAASITVDPAIDLTGGYSFRWRKTACGTTAGFGWQPAFGDDVTAYFEYNQGDSTVDMRVECVGSYFGAQPVVVVPLEGYGCEGGTLSSGYCQFATGTVGIGNRFYKQIDGQWQQCRMAIKINGSDTSETTTNLERITAGLIVHKVR